MGAKQPIVILEKKGNIARVTINRPEKRNALNQGVRDAFISIFEDIQKDDEIKVVTTTGAGDLAYSAGMDLNDLMYRREHPEVPNPPSISETVKDCPKVTIAVVNGYCLGAGLSTMACHDLAIASEEKAKFGLPEVMRDLVPRGAVARICQNASRKWALEMLLTGKNWDAKRAYQAGLINRIVPHAQLQEAAYEWALEIARWDPVTLLYCKKAAYAIMDAKTYQEQMEAGNFWHEEYGKAKPEWTRLRDTIAGNGIKANT